MCLSSIAFVLSSGVLRLGPLRLSVFGLCAAVGLVAAFTLAQKTAPRSGLTAAQVGDAGLFAVAAAFVLSRLLLIARDPNAFLSYPRIILTLPSLTYGGIALTAVATGVYVWRKKLPPLPLLDAWSVAAALLAAALACGHWFEGTDAGMPTSLPWGVLAGGSVKLHPVQLYAAVAALALCGALLSLPKPRSGLITACALTAGGAAAFLLDMLTQPVVLASAWLEPGQWIALGAMMVGGVLFAARIKPNSRFPRE